jgi:hypothetical protein
MSSQETITPAKKAGRCANGAELDQGSVIHGVAGKPNNYGDVFGKALCGTQPGRRSVGWTTMSEKSISCPKCLNKIRRTS